MEQILAEIESLVRRAEPSDTILFSYNGHGIERGELYLLLHRSDLDRLETTALRWSDIEERVSRSAARVLVLLDACHAGFATTAVAVHQDAAINRLATWSGPPIVILAASKGREKSIEIAGNGGYFTTTFARILTEDRKRFDLNGNGFLEISELYAGLKQEVVRISGGQQTPWIGRHGMIGDFTLF